MGYIGVTPEAGFTTGLLDRFTGTTGTTVTLTHEISSENDIIVFVNFVKQDSTNYSVGGSGNKTLTLGGTLVSSDVVEVHYLNIVNQTSAPSAGSVGSSQITADVITGQTALASEPADTDEFLVSDAGTLKRIDYSLIKGSGKFLQISTLASDSTASTSSSSFVDAITLTGITPVAQNSKFLIELMGGYTQMPNDKYMATRFQVRENSGSYATLMTGSQYAATMHGTNSTYLTSPHSFSYLYSPTDTSSLTALAVNVQFASVNTSGTVNWNYAGLDSGNGDGYVLLKVIEIGA